MKSASTSCSLTQEVSQDLNKASVVTVKSARPITCLSSLSEQLIGIQKLLMKASAPPPNLGKQLFLTCSPTNTCTVCRLDFSRLTIHYFLANPTLQYNSSSTNYISEMELWEAIDSDLWSHKGLFPVLHMDFPHLTLLIGTPFLASYNLTMYDKSHDPLVGAEVAWYNSYGPTKVPHTCDFQCVITT